jgi:hypothetical protein
VLAVNYGEYDLKKYLEVLDQAYDTITESLFPQRKNPFLCPQDAGPWQAIRSSVFLPVHSLTHLQTSPQFKDS